MCLAVPAEIIQLSDGVATCRVGDSQSTIRASTMLLPESPNLGDYLIIHAGFALRVMDLEEAKESLRLLRADACVAPGAEAPWETARGTAAGAPGKGQP
jgi:hydrogenase expression/formation protein HypC